LANLFGRTFGGKIIYDRVNNIKLTLLRFFIKKCIKFLIILI